jgi:hypothetical protein
MTEPLSPPVEPADRDMRRTYTAVVVIEVVVVALLWLFGWYFGR